MGTRQQQLSVLEQGAGQHAVSANPHWWTIQGTWVEEVNERRGGMSGIQWVMDADSGTPYFVKRQVNHLYRSLRFPFGRPTLLREWLNLKHCANLGIPTPSPVFFDMRRGGQGWEAILVTRGLDNYMSLEDGITQRLWTPEQWREILIALARELAPLHRVGRKHGHLYPKEVFVRTSPSIEIAFLDWEMGRYVGSSRFAAQSDLGRLWRSLIALGVSDDDRRFFLNCYESIISVRQLKLRGVSST
jgi:tRNA A-37 threonylcarbamoyl transferase component Bud32